MAGRALGAVLCDRCNRTDPENVVGNVVVPCVWIGELQAERMQTAMAAVRDRSRS